MYEDPKLLLDLSAAFAKSTTTLNKAVSKAYADAAARATAAPPPIVVPPPVVIPPVTPPAPTNLDRVVYCTQSPHEANPHGVPASYDWATHPTGLGAQNWNAGKGPVASAPDGCLWFWGQVYLAADQS